MYKYYHVLCVRVLVLLLLVNGGRASPTNIARGKDTASSSPTYNGRSPSIVVDGVTEDSSLGGGIPHNCADCFYIGPSGSAHYWRVDLGNQYFITRVKVYTGKISYTMSGVSILTRGDESPFVDPSGHPDQWNQLYSGSDIDGEFTKTLDTAVYARHVAVRVPRSRQLVLTEVEVYGCATAEFKPISLQITQVTSDCVTLRWDHPHDDKAKYQYKCGSTSWKSSDNTRPSALCRISPSAGMTCRVRVKDVAETEVSKDISCSDFTIPQPTGLSFGPPAKVKSSGRWRYRYTVTWIVPSYYSTCLHATNPYQWKVDSYSKTLHNANSWTLYRDGGVDVTVRVWVRNEDGELSTPATKSTTVPTDIPPQVAPRNFQLTAASPYCVSLSWNPVQYPNGPESGIVYQHSCNSNSWTNIPGDKRVCGFTPNTLVSCKIRARRESNSAGNRNSEETGVKIVTTICVQNPPTDLKFNSPEQVTQSDRQRWKYTVTWQEPETYGCIYPTNPYKIQIDSNSPTNHNQNSYILYRDGGEVVTVRIWLRDKNGVLSDVVTKSTISPVVNLPPQIVPRNFQLTAVSPSCVSLSWDPVQYPNGPESGIVYQYNCHSTGWTNIPNNKKVCGYSPSTLLSCKIRARRESNSVGNRDSEETDGESVTTCNDPFDDSSIQINTPVLKTESRRKRWKYTVSWQIRSGYNCDKSSPKYKLEIDRNTKLSNSTWTSYSFYTDGYVDVTVKLWLLYETGELSTPGTKSFITQTGLSPQVAPRNFQLTAVSPYCVSLSWDPVQYPNGPESGIVYQYNCNSIGWNNIPIEKKVCGFTPESLISCKIRARRESNSAGDRDSRETGIKTVRTSCAQIPAVPEAAVTTEKMMVNERDRTKLVILWKESEPGCTSILYYNLTIQLNTEQIFHHKYLPTDKREAVIEDLDPYTKYTLTLIAVNDAMRASSSEPNYILTPELAPYDRPGLEVDFNSSCAYLFVNEPVEPNGVITHYQVSCDYADSGPSTYTNISVTEVQPHTVCGFRSAEKIECRVKAVNTAGESPDTSVTGYTHVEVLGFEPVRIGKVDTQTEVTIYPVKIDKNVAEIRSYILVVRKTGHGEASCIDEVLTRYKSTGSSNSSCYIAAEILASSVTHGGYRQDLGDGNLYFGKFLNSPLTQDVTYTVSLAVYIIKGDIEFSQLVTSTNLFTVQEKRCPAPPPVKHTNLYGAEAGLWKVNSSIIYSCQEGYIRSGDPEIVCSVVGKEAKWIGDLPSCESKDFATGNTTGLTAGIAGGVVVLIIVIVIVLVIFYRRRVTPPESTSESTSESRVQQPPVGDEYEEIRLASVPVYDRPSSAPTYCVVGEEEMPPQYESLDSINRESTAGYEKLPVQLTSQSATGIYENNIQI